MKLYSNDYRAYFIAGMAVLAIVAAGFVALYYIKKHGKSFYEREGAAAFLGILVGGALLMYVASYIGFGITGRGRYVAVTIFPGIATALDALSFVALTFIGVALQVHLFNSGAGPAIHSSNDSVPARATLILAIVYGLWATTKGIQLAALEPDYLAELPQIIWSETVDGCLWVLQVFYAALSGPLGALEKLGTTYLDARGNQFETAKYFTGVLLLWAAIDAVIKAIRGTPSQAS